MEDEEENGSAGFLHLVRWYRHRFPVGAIHDAAIVAGAHLPVEWQAHFVPKGTSNL
jgi:hypothetical protein